MRNPTGIRHPKLQELVHGDFTDFSGMDAQLRGLDACFYCLGVSVAGMSEAEYRRVTHDFAIAAATELARLNPDMVFIYVSGAGTDSTGKGRAMWARVKGETEIALLRLPFRAAYMFRPAYIHAAHGERSKTPSYRVLYSATGWLFPILRRLFPRHVITTEQLGRAMLRVAREAPPSQRVENADIVRYGS